MAWGDTPDTPFDDYGGDGSELDYLECGCLDGCCRCEEPEEDDSYPLLEQEREYEYNYEEIYGLGEYNDSLYEPDPKD